MGFWFGFAIFLFVLLIVALLGFYVYTNILSKECDQHDSVINKRKTSKPVKDEVVKDYSSGDE